jgi:hypothetical protein
MVKNRRLPLWVVLGILAVLIPLTVGAQTSGIHIHESPAPEQVTTAGGAVGLSLQTAFSLLDSENQVMMSFEIASATMEVEGNSYPAVVQELETPWTIVVLVDASKTMGGFATAAAFKDVRNAISSAIGGVPDNTNLALLTFDDGVHTQVEFTQETDAINASMRGLIAKGFGTSCLNNGIYEAANKLSGAPGRRAVVVFTASTDDCATRTAQEVAELAQRNRVQIYPVGLLGYSITKDELDALADPTGGLAELKDESTLGFGFSNIMAVLSNQWTARATVYPSAGEQQATLTINLQDETVLTSPPIGFTSAQDYIPPAEIHLKGQVQSTGDGILFSLDITQRDVIRQLNVSIISNETGQSVAAQALVSFSDVNTLPAVGLIPGSEYTLIVNAIDEQGQVLSEASAEFEYQPPPAQLTITEVLAPTTGQDAFEITVSSQNVGSAVKYTAWLVDEESEQRIDDSRVTVPLGEPILIPTDDIDKGSYLVVVQALDSVDTVLAESPPVKAILTRPGLIENLGESIGGSPLAIVGLTGFCLLSLIGVAVLIWYVLPKRGMRPGTVELVMPQKERRPAPGTPRAVPTPPQKEPEPAPPPPPASPQPPTPSAPQVAAKPNAYVQLKDSKLEFKTEIRKPVFTIGRRKSNDAALPLDSASGVSGEHLTIRFENGQYYAQDDKSSYGTELDGRLMDKGVPYLLRDGAVLTLGPKVSIEFRLG